MTLTRAWRQGGLVLLCASVASLGATAVLAAGPEAPGPGSPQEAGPAQTAKPAPAAADEPGSATAAQQRLRQDRSNRAKRPVDEQVAEVAAGTRQSSNEVEGRAKIVVTLRKPMPWPRFARQQESDRSGRLPSNANVTAYMETDDGYPLILAGSPGAALDSELSAYARQLSQQLGSGKFQGRSAAGRSSDASRARQLDSASASANQRVVVLGFTLSYEDYERARESLPKNYAVTGAEVYLSKSGMAFLDDDKRMTPARVAQLDDEYARAPQDKRGMR